MPPCRFQQCLGPFSMMTVKRCSEIRLFRDFAVRTFWTYICYDGHVFFQKVQFFYVDFRIYQKIWKKFFFFLRNCIWGDCCKFSPLRLAVYVSTNNSKSSYITNRDILQLHFCQSVGKIWLKCWSADFSSVWNPSACLLSDVVLKRGLLDIYLTPCFTVRDLANTQALIVMGFFNILEISLKFLEWSKKFRKSFLFVR